MNNLTETEKKSLIRISDNYKSVYSDIELVEKQLLKLIDKKEELLAILEGTRKKEWEIYSQLEERYGKGSIDPQTLNWIKDE